MFNIKTFDICQVTGFVTFEIEFAMWDRPARVFKENYKTESDARRRIERLQTDYLLFTLENYVTACRNLFELNISRNSNTRKLAFEKCSSGLHYMQDKQLTSIAALIVKIKPFLTQLLPPESTPDFDFLNKIQLRLINFSNKILTPKTTELCQAS